MLPAPAFADRAFWGCAYQSPRILHAGDLVCRQEVQQCTRMTLSCSRGARLLFTAEDFADYIASSADGQYVVGLSNRGSVSAFWVRKSSGELVERKLHVPMNGIHYCSESVTNVREWFDAKNPNVRFRFRNGALVQVLVRSCDGKDLGLRQ